MEYSQKWIQVTRAQLLADLATTISKKRYEHVLRVEQTAIELAKLNQVDVEKASIAALLHDYAKELELSEMRELAKRQWDTPLLDAVNGNILHGFAAATIAREKYGVQDEDILTAIAVHTIGWEQMTPLVSVVFVADYVEPNRDFSGVEQVRELAYQDIEAAVGYKLSYNLILSIQRKRALFLPSVEFYNKWTQRIKK